MSLPCFGRASDVGFDIADIGFVAIGLAGLTGSAPEQPALNAILFGPLAGLLAWFRRLRLRIMSLDWLCITPGLLPGIVAAMFERQFALSRMVLGAPQRKPSLVRSAPVFAHDVIRLDLARPCPT